MIYSLFFLMCIIVTTYYIYLLDSIYLFLLIPILINFSIMTVAYFFNNPKLILNKTSNGEINYILLVLNFPWIALTSIIFKIQVLLSKEDFCNRIGNTKFYISRKPFKNDPIEDFDLVIDLTAEFPLNYKSKNYLCLSNLDGHILKHINISLDLSQHQKILIHCANGHGRSSMMVALLLKSNHIVDSIESGLKLIKDSRNKAYPNSFQIKWLLKQ